MDPQDFSLKVILRERRYLLLSVLSWIVVILLTFTIVIPQFQQIIADRQQLESEQSTFKQTQSKLQFLEGFNNEQFTAQSTQVDRILPSAKPFFQLLTALRELANQQGVVFSGLDWNIGLVASDSAQPAQPEKQTTKKTAQPAQSTDELERMGLELTILGSSPQITSYLDAMSRITPVVEIDDVTLSPRFQIQDGFYEAKLKITSFYAPLAALRSARLNDRLLPKFSTAEQEYLGTLGEYVVFENEIGQNTATSSARNNIFGF
jgi:Tfp pilus assembly protein PilO